MKKPKETMLLMRRYLYVGISRATSHLAATMKPNASSDIIKYFDTENDSWVN